jgi:hypothetical protein
MIAAGMNLPATIFAAAGFAVVDTDRELKNISPSANLFSFARQSRAVLNTGKKKGGHPP